ncbi:hypothetical protein BCIN_16g03050 [Botrytis cinerea B05.10]|uniref:Uncharacterized protein n=1 Tax=Botryotinia fuckeliana (strain B05.10) TaxID=332648 RepID=A0A384K6U7_BOTFB|nr:hypothetical protein BCIN_16g03050 [Botrytis cinerea B05.10]ATZ58553.1 hypothetical protein BCIN_16g03050 [Botrytis cinerea B05.10]
MNLQKFLVVLSSLTVVGLSAPVVSQETLEIIELNKPTAIIPTGHALDQQSPNTNTHHISQPTKKDAFEILDKTTELALSRKSTLKPIEIILPKSPTNQNKREDQTISVALSLKTTKNPIETLIPTFTSPQKKRGDETIVWAPPPPTSKIPQRRGDATVVWVQPPPTPKIPM